MNRRFACRALVLIVPASGVAGCGEDAESRFERLAARAEEVRELSFVREVPVRAISPDELEALAERDAAAAEEAELAKLAASYGRLGFFPVDADLREILGETRDWVAGWYSADAGGIFVVGDVHDDTLVHEYVHGLQDQHFDLGSLDEATSTSDEFLARRAVVEGDAMLAQLRFLIQESHGADLDGMNWSEIFASMRLTSEEMLADSDLPLFFMAYPSFVYTFGLEYCAHNLTGASAARPQAQVAFPFDWSREDALLSERLPATTQQILRLDGEDEAVPVGLEDVPPALADRLERIAWDSLGQWYSYLLLRPLSLPLDDPRALAAAWDGDRALFVRDMKTGAMGTAWASAWDDAEAAWRVESALWELYDALVVDEAEPRLGLSGDGEPVWIERREELVVALKNVDPELMPALAEAAFPEGVAPRRLVLRSRPSPAAWLWKNLPALP